MTARQRIAIPLIRCSTNAQAGTSTDDQLRVIQPLAASRDIVLLEPIRLEGLSGADESTINAIVAELIERKRTRNDFTDVISQDLSRVTRGGPTHAAYIRYLLEAARVVHAEGGQP